VVATPAWEFTSPGNSYSNGIWLFATAFTANTDVVVSRLGYFVDPATRSLNPSPTALYECADAGCLTTATLLTSTIVDTTGTLVGHFRYAAIAPVTLEAGKSYEVAGISNGNLYTWDDAGYRDDPAVTRLSTSGQYARWTEIDGFTLDTPGFLTGSVVNDIGLVDGFQGANLFLGTPEPATWTVLIAGFGLVGAVLRRRRAVLAPV
jgi:hypothetical protein